MRNSKCGHYLNMSAGQTPIEPYVLAALAEMVDTPIYYPEFWKVKHQAIELLKQFMHTSHEVLLLTGTATYGLEAVLKSAFEPGDKIIVINSGLFGQLLVDLIRITGLEALEIKVPYGKVLDSSQVDTLIRKESKAKAVALCHVDTSVGVLNPVAEVGEIVRRYQLLYIVDAVSSLGGTDLYVDEWGIDFCISSSQKCLNAPQGIAIVSVSDRAWEVIQTRKRPTGTLCLDLEAWREYHRLDKVSLANWNLGRPVYLSSETKAIHLPSLSWILVRALEKALERIAQEGLERVIYRHNVASLAIRSGVRAMGLRVVAEESAASNMVTAVYCPKGIEEFRVRRHMLTKYGIALGAGPVEIGLNAFRIGNMGFVASPPYVLSCLACLELTLRDLGVKIELGSGVAAAEEVLVQYWKGVE